MEAVEMKDMKVGWWGLFDAMYGPEKVLAIEPYALGPNQAGMRVFATSNEGGIWPVIKFHVTDERGDRPGGRNIIRFPSEPVMAMSFPDLPVEVGVAEGED